MLRRADETNIDGMTSFILLFYREMLQTKGILIRAVNYDGQKLFWLQNVFFFFPSVNQTLPSNESNTDVLLL